LNIGTSTLKSTGWSTGGLVVNQVLTFGRVAVLARLLSPEDFGLYAMAFVFYSLVQTMGNIGTSAALIQRKSPSAELVSSVFYLNILLGVLLSALVFGTAPLVAYFYGESQVELILKWLSVVFFVASLGLVHGTLLRKEMQFDSVTKSDVFANFLSTILCVVLAYKGFGAYSFVFQMISYTILSTILLWVYEKWKPELKFSVSEIKTVVSFSLNLTVFNIVNHIAVNVDKFLIGKFLGTSALGTYYIAYRIILMPMKQVTNSVKNVLYSTLSKLQSDLDKLQTILLKSIHMIMLVSMPCMFLVMTLADMFTHVVLGDVWAAAEPIIMVFAPVALLQAASAPAILLFLVKDKTPQMVRLSVINLFVVPLGVILGAQWGANLGVAIGYSVATIFMSVLVMVKSLALLELTIKDVLNELKWVIAKSCYACIVAYGLKKLIEAYTTFTELQTLVVVVFVSVLFYCAVSFKVVVSEFKFFKSFV